MKLLLDENLPKQLKNDFPDHEIYTVREKGCAGVKNGQLLKLMIEEQFDALISFDKNLGHQQNFIKLPITVFVISAKDNTYQTVSKLSGTINDHLKKNLRIGSVEIRE